MGKRFYLLVVFLISIFLILEVKVFSGTLAFPYVEPVGDMPVYYGWGYDTSRHTFTAPCVNFDRNAILKTGKSKEKSSFRLVQSTSEIAESSNLSVDASLKILSGTVYKASDKLSVVSGSKASAFNVSLYAHVMKYYVPSYIDIGTVSIKPEMLDLIRQPGGMAKFRQKCGNAFVIGIREGREFLGLATVKKQTLKSWTKFANKANVSAKGAWGNAEVDTSLAKSLEESFSSSSIEINVYSTGSSMFEPTNLDQLTEYFRKFLSQNGEKEVVSYIIAPYSILNDYPQQDVLNMDSKEEYLNTLIVSLWDLKSGIEDAKMVLSKKTQELFALGTIQSKRRQHINTIAMYKRAWEKEFDQLLKATKMCNKNFTEKCKKLAIYYGRFRNFYDEWDAVMPEKYLSDCKTPIILSDAAFKNLKMSIEGVRQQRVHGDSEGGGGSSKTRIVVVMRIVPDGRKLKAEVSLARIEWKRKRSKYYPIEAKMKGESAWALYAKETIFDLDNPMAYGLQPDTNLKYCTWNPKTHGVKNPVVRNIPPAASYFTRYGFKKFRTSANGYIDGMTGKSPRGDQTFAGGKGILDYIICQADRKGSDDRLVCKKIAFKEVMLDLVSTQDLKADRWIPPKNPSVPVQLASFFSNGYIQLKLRRMRTSGSMSPSARKLNMKRQKLINDFKFKGLIKLNFSPRSLKNLKLKPADSVQGNKIRLNLH